MVLNWLDWRCRYPARLAGAGDGAETRIRRINRWSSHSCEPRRHSCRRADRKRVETSLDMARTSRAQHYLGSEYVNNSPPERFFSASFHTSASLLSTV